MLISSTFSVDGSFCYKMEKIGNLTGKAPCSLKIKHLNVSLTLCLYRSYPAAATNGRTRVNERPAVNERPVTVVSNGSITSNTSKGSNRSSTGESVGLLFPFNINNIRPELCLFCSLEYTWAPISVAFLTSRSTRGILISSMSMCTNLAAGPAASSPQRVSDAPEIPVSG